MSEALLEFVEAFRKLLVSVWKRMKVILARVVRFIQVIRKDKPVAKVRYDPVRKISPRKPRLFDKRTNIYYCRNNC